MPSDLLRLALPGDPQLAPDGRVFYVLATFDEPADAVRRAIWLAGDGPPRAFTAGPNDTMPRLSQDGTQLAFVAEREGGKRIYLIPTGGGEARALSPVADAIAGLCWSPDGSMLAYAATCPFDRASAPIALDERSGARHIRRLPYKSDDDGLLDGRRKHLFTLAIVGGEPLQRTRGDFDVHEPSWSPDGTRLAFCARIGGREDGFCEDLHVIELASAELRTLTAREGPVASPAFSHDGRELAFIGHRKGESVSGRFDSELLAIPAEGGAIRSLSAELGRSLDDAILYETRGAGGASAPQWSADDRELFVLVADEGACGLRAFARDGTGHRIVAGGERVIYACSRAPGGT
ncbi:MAG: hypothetical protein ACREM2_12320, partial [Vulcanimicrobiaceae bacterium]